VFNQNTIFEENKILRNTMKKNSFFASDSYRPDEGKHCISKSNHHTSWGWSNRCQFSSTLTNVLQSKIIVKTWLKPLFNLSNLGATGAFFIKLRGHSNIT
jgi:hypothetical protein